MDEKDCVHASGVMMCKVEVRANKVTAEIEFANPYEKGHEFCQLADAASLFVIGLMDKTQDPHKFLEYFAVKTIELYHNQRVETGN